MSISQKVKIKDLDFESLIGKRYKNWKQFCEENNINYNRNTDFVKLQKKELQRYTKVKWIGKNKREFIIKEIYEQPKPNTSTRGKDGDISMPLEELLRYLPQDEYMSISKIMLELGLVSQDYIFYKFNRAKCVKEIMYELANVNDDKNYLVLSKLVNNFYMYSEFIHESIKNKLNTLVKNGNITLEAKIKIKKDNECRYATLEEEDIINQAETYILEQLEKSTKSEIMFVTDFEKFYKKVKEVLFECEIDADDYYPVYNIKFVNDKKGRAPSENTINQLKHKLQYLYLNKVKDKLNSKRNIELVQSMSGDVSINLGYLNSLYEILLCKAPFVKRQYKENNIERKKINDYVSKYNHIPKGKGVYYIIDNDKNIYIGSTNTSFRKRYSQHMSKSNNCTSKQIVSKEHHFGVLFDMTGIEDVWLIREIEGIFIDYFKEDNDFAVVNEKIEGVHSLLTKIMENKKTIVIANDEDYSKVLRLLSENNIVLNFN